MFGKCGRAGHGPLVQRQYRDNDAELSAALVRAIHFDCCLLQTQDMACPGLGFVLCRLDLQQTLGGAAFVQPVVLSAFCDRKTQIMLLAYAL